MELTITVDLNEFKRNGINNEEKAFIEAMADMGVEEENVLRYLALRKLGLNYDGYDYTLMLDCSNFWNSAKNYFCKKDA